MQTESSDFEKNLKNEFVSLPSEDLILENMSFNYNGQIFFTDLKIFLSSSKTLNSIYSADFAQNFDFKIEFKKNWQSIPSLFSYKKNQIQSQACLIKNISQIETFSSVIEKKDLLIELQEEDISGILSFSGALALRSFQTGFQGIESVSKKNLRQIHIIIKDSLDLKSAQALLKRNLLISFSAFVTGSINIGVAKTTSEYFEFVQSFYRYLNNESLITPNLLEIKKIEKNQLSSKDYPFINAVARGSVNEDDIACLIELLPKEKDLNEIKFSIIGKGVIFDTGGYSLKPSESMLIIHLDKIGAGYALGLAFFNPLLARTLIGVVKNFVSQSGYVPGEILQGYSFQSGAKKEFSVEVRNTDAEGRLVLADVLNYAQKDFNSLEKKHTFITVATLTGAACVAAGLGGAILTCQNQDDLILCQTAIRQSKENCLAAILPWNINFIDSAHANLSNICTNSLGAKSQAGAFFVNNFISPHNRLIHFDIAAICDVWYHQKKHLIFPFLGLTSILETIKAFQKI